MKWPWRRASEPLRGKTLSDPTIVGTRENRPAHSSTSRPAAGRANSGHVTRLVHHRGRRDSEDRPRSPPGPPVGKEEPDTVGGPDPPSPRRGPGEPRAAKAKGRGARQSGGSANGRARWPQLPPPHRIPGARVAFAQAAEAAPAHPLARPPARASIRVLARCSPGAAAAGHGGEGQVVPVAAAGSLFGELEVGTAGVKASAGGRAGTSPFFLLQTRGGSGRAAGKTCGLPRRTLTPVGCPGRLGQAGVLGAGGTPVRRAEGLRARAGEGCRVAVGLPQPPLLPAQLLGDRAGEGVILHIPHLAPPPRFNQTCGGRKSRPLASAGWPALPPAVA